MSEAAKLSVRKLLETVADEATPETEPTNPSLMFPSESEDDYSMVSLSCVPAVINVNCPAISGVPYAMIGILQSSSALVAELAYVTRTSTGTTWGV
jgi:hypothetical protein